MPVRACIRKTKSVSPPKQNQKRRACTGTGFSNRLRCSRSVSLKRSSNGRAIAASIRDIVEPPLRVLGETGDDDLARGDLEHRRVHVAGGRSGDLGAVELEEARVARAGVLRDLLVPMELARDVR